MKSPEPSAGSRQEAFAILTQHGDVLQDDVSLNDLIDDIAAAIDERDLWKARCFAALWLVPDEKTCGELQEAARQAKALLRGPNDPVPERG